jgi:hypothetical protein
MDRDRSDQRYRQSISQRLHDLEELAEHIFAAVRSDGTPDSRDALKTTARRSKPDQVRGARRPKAARKQKQL